jgi:putative ABC transport system permease protein
MRMLNRKLLRDLVRLRGQVLSIALVVAAGVMAVIVMQSTFRTLERSRDAYYHDYRFADVFASLHRAPESVAARIEAVPGVGSVRTRVVQEVTLQVPGLERPATGRVVSVPDRPGAVLNDLHLVSGRWPEPRRDDEVLVSEAFATVNELAAGDTLRAVINGRLRALRIVGVAISPEFVYETEPAGGFLTDQRLFGVLWMGREALAAAADMTGAFNDVVLALAPGASERAVLERVDALLSPYGGLGAYGRADHLSDRLLSDEIEQNRVTALVIPGVFLAVAAFLLHIVMLRLVSTERDQIATLKAFGYEDASIAGHYLLFALSAVGAGVLLGGLAGSRLGIAYTAIYAEHFRFPELRFTIGWGTAAGAAAVSAAAAVAGALGAVRTAVRLQPAEGMRPEAPPVFRPLLLERFGLHRWLSSAQRMVMRNLERRPVRALISATGVGMAMSVLLVGMLMLDSVEAMMERQFHVVQAEDLLVAFGRPANSSALRELERIPGVVQAEAFRTVPVRLSNGHVERRLALTGIEPGGQLRRMAGADGATRPLPESGVVLTERLARTLGVGPGDVLRAERLDRPGHVARIPVAATMDEMLGVNGYLALPELNRLAWEAPVISGAYLRIARGAEPGVHARLAAMPGVAMAISKTAMVESFEDQMAASFTITIMILLLLAAVLAIGVIYNGARIALSERGRELASLRVLGFTRAEVAAMLLGEQAVITLLGLPLGILFGYGVAALVIGAYDTELYRIPFVAEPGSIVFASVAIIVIAAAAGLLVRRRLDRADLIAVLKTRE